ncbi:MAG: PadR family transcriptional regulator [Acidimicrobiales bacterium]|jgi:DNA-binding PadR family transcriptional regulator
MTQNRSNPLALAVLVSLLERHMHPYEVATTLRQREKQRSVRLNYGALYRVVESLAKRGLIETKEIGRAGRLPERTIYQLTDAGRLEINDWLAELLSTPTIEYPQLVAGLSFLAALPPEQVIGLLKVRLTRLTLEEAQAGAIREVVQKRGLPRLLWVDEQYRDRLLAAEIDYVRSLLGEIESGALEGAEWWREVHERGFDRVPPPFDPEQLLELRHRDTDVLSDIEEDQP